MLVQGRKGEGVSLRQGLSMRQLSMVSNNDLGSRCGVASVLKPPVGAGNLLHLLRSCTSLAYDGTVLFTALGVSTSPRHSVRERASVSFGGILRVKVMGTVRLTG